MSILPKLYCRTPEMISIFEDRLSGKASAIGPHMPTQCKLANIPRKKADIKIENTFVMLNV